MVSMLNMADISKLAQLFQHDFDGGREPSRDMVQLDQPCLTRDSMEKLTFWKALLRGHNSGVGLPSESEKEMEMKLFYLASTGDLTGIQRIVEHGTSIDAVDYNSRSALHIAAEKGQLKVVEYLISCRADVNAKDTFGETALSLATNRKHREIEALLCDAGAKMSGGVTYEMKAKRSRRASFAVMEAFPQAIAVAMLEGRKIEPISKNNVSLLFSDIVGFTSISSELDAVKVSGLLVRLFSKLDKLCYLHGVQKIDVVGDAYIAATNFMEEQSTDHAARLARFAIDAMRAARETLVDEEHPELFGYVQLRIGMHCGPVSGSVVGLQNLKYTLIGDSVNIASRMETTSLAHRIQCTETISNLIAEQAPDMVISKREGGVDIKGKGWMQTYWLTSLRRGQRGFGSCPDLTSLCRDTFRRTASQSQRGHFWTSDALPAAAAAAAAAARGDCPEKEVQQAAAATMGKAPPPHHAPQPHTVRPPAGGGWSTAPPARGDSAGVGKDDAARGRGAAAAAMAASASDAGPEEEDGRHAETAAAAAAAAAGERVMHPRLQWLVNGRSQILRR